MDTEKQFLFHSVLEAGGQTRYYNIYRIDDSHFFAECHHFNRERSCEGDFELHKENEGWKSASGFDTEAQQIGEEIDRMLEGDAE